ncbi:MAG: helix-turn-helix domain-containing protein [Chloroflexota bacterium]|nr:helix-turn-helix domain-containing protein [Chloroflexota bacterium]
MSIQLLTLEQICKERAHGSAPPPHQEMEAGRFLSVSPTGPTAPANLHEVLRHLMTTLTLSLPLDQVLTSLARLTMQALNVDLCTVLLRNYAYNDFRLYAWSPDLSEKGINVQPVHIDTETLEVLHLTSLHGRLPQLSYRQLEALNPLKNVQFAALLPVPLCIGGECIGLLNCYASKSTRYNDDDELMLTTIATQVALAIRHLQGVDEDTLAQKRLVKALVTDLCCGAADGEDALRRRARIPGFDLSKAHTVALLELSEGTTFQERFLSKEERLSLHSSIVKQIKHYLEGRYPGSLLDERDNQLVCLLNLDKNTSFEQLHACLDELERRVRDEYAIALMAGIGNLCHAVGDYQRSYAEACAALEVGPCLHREYGCTHFNELGAYRYIYKFAQTDTLSDQYQKQIELIVDYDRRKKTNLLETLEIYLECSGNVAKTSSLLDVHRNTLLQRLERLQKLCDLDLEQCQHRLPLLIALKVYRLRIGS